MSFARASGILLHPTSLPSRGGIGDFGPAAYQFVDFLASARQGIWQILPLGPIGFGNSPYSANSATGAVPAIVREYVYLGGRLLATIGPAEEAALMARVTSVSASPVSGTRMPGGLRISFSSMLCALDTSYRVGTSGRTS